jgi:hypothetical protein
VIVEFTESAVHIANDARSIELPLERDPTGALTPGAIEAARNALASFATRSGQREHAFCLLPARGVSLRRISIPASNRADIERLLPLQIDAQFPLSAAELAWGYSRLNSTGAMSELTVAAVKIDLIQTYRDLLAGAGFEPLFAIAALARPKLSSHAPTKFGVVEIGAQKSELVTLDESGPATLRVINLGADAGSSTDPLLDTLRNNGAVQKIYVSGKSAALWSQRISPGIPAEMLMVPAGQTAAVAGLRESLRRGEEPLLLCASREVAAVQRTPSQWRWAIAAAILGLIALGLRFAEPALRRAQLNKTISDLTAARAKLPKLDREVAFLQYIKTNQPPYIDLVAALASSAQPGTKFDAISISRRGDLSVRGTAQGAQAPGSLRAKMYESGYFSTVVLDEQTPGQNNQMSFHLTAQLRSEAERKLPPPKPPEAAATNHSPAHKNPATNSVATNVTNNLTPPKP